MQQLYILQYPRRIQFSAIIEILNSPIAICDGNRAIKNCSYTLSIKKDKIFVSSTHARKLCVFNDLKQAGRWCFLTSEEVGKKTFIIGEKTHDSEKNSPDREHNFENAASNGKYWYSSWCFDTISSRLSIRCSSDRLENSHVQLALDT